MQVRRRETRRRSRCEAVRDNLTVNASFAITSRLTDGSMGSAGRAVVQMVRSPLDDQLYAIKFFGSRAAFQDARRLHLHETLGRFMPAVIEFVANENDVFCDPFDHPMPPCVVMENGESLTHRAVSCRNDAAASAQVRNPI